MEGIAMEAAPAKKKRKRDAVEDLKDVLLKGAREHDIELLVQRVLDEDVDAARDLLDVCWERLHHGRWDAVWMGWRDFYALATICIVEDEAIGLEAPVERSLHVMKQLDLAWLMGGEHMLSILEDKIRSCETALPEIAEASVLKLFSECSPRKLNVPETGIPIDRCLDPGIMQFKSKYLDSGMPVVVMNLMEHWPARGAGSDCRSWDNVHYLKRILGHRTVPVEVGSNYTDENWTQTLMPFSEFIDRHLLTEKSNIGYLAQHQLLEQVEELKDDIRMPDYCCLGESSDVKINVWIGPGSTTSPLHFDPEHNIFCQVVGSKYVRLYDSKYSSELHPMSGMLNNTSQIDVLNPDLALYPDFNLIPYFDCIVKGGEALFIPKGLASIALAKPADPIDYLSKWLLNYVHNKKLDLNRESNADSDCAAEQLFRDRAKKRDKDAADKASIEQKRRDEDSKLMAVAESDESESSLFKAFVDLLVCRCGGASVYLGRPFPAQSESSDTPRRLEYVSVSDDQRFMLDQVLEQDKGITFAKVVTAATTSSESETVDKNENESIEGGAIDPIIRKVVVDNVVMGDWLNQMHFFTLPRIGSYMALCIDYDTLLNDEAFAMKDGEFTLPILPDNQVSPLIVQSGEEQAGATTITAAAAATTEQLNNDGVPKPLNDVSQPKPQPPRKRVQLVVCIDTLAQLRLLTQSDTIEAERLAILFRQAIHQLDMRLYMAQREFHRQCIELSVKIAARDANHIEQATRTLHESMFGDKNSEATIPLANEMIAFELAKQQVAEASSVIGLLTKVNLLKVPEQLAASIPILLGKSNQLLIDRFGLYRWWRIRTALDSEIGDKLSTCEIDQFDASIVDKVKSVLGDIKEDVISNEFYVFKPILQLLRSIIALKDAQLKLKEAAQAAASQSQVQVDDGENAPQTPNAEE